MGSVAARAAGLGLRLAAEVAAGRRLAAHDDLRPRADQRVRGVSVLQRRLEARAAVAAHAHGIVDVLGTIVDAEASTFVRVVSRAHTQSRLFPVFAQRAYFAWPFSAS